MHAISDAIIRNIIVIVYNNHNVQFYAYTNGCSYCRNHINSKKKLKIDYRDIDGQTYIYKNNN